MGATLDQAEAAMNKLGTNQATSTHPAKTDRLNSISRGWNYANNMAPQQTKPEPSTNPNPNTNPQPAPTIPQGNGNTTTNDDNDPASWIYLTHSGNQYIVV
jgi:hypothetical protein